MPENDQNEAFLDAVASGRVATGGAPGTLPQGAQQVANMANPPPVPAPGPEDDLVETMLDGSDWEALTPQAKSEVNRLRRAEREKESLKGELAAFKDQLSQLQQQQNQAPAPQGPPKDGIEAIPTGKLSDWVAAQEGALQALALDPENEEAKSTVQAMDTRLLNQARLVLARRVAEEPIAKLRDELAGQKEADMLDSYAQSVAIQEYGHQAMYDQGEDSLVAKAREVRDATLAKFHVKPDQATKGHLEALVNDLSLQNAALQRQTTRADGAPRAPRGPLDLVAPMRGSSSMGQTRSPASSGSDEDAILAGLRRELGMQ